MKKDIKSVTVAWGTKFVKDHLFEPGPSFTIRLAATLVRVKSPRSISEPVMHDSNSAIASAKKANSLSRKNKEVPKKGVGMAALSPT